MVGIILILLAALAAAQTPDPAYAPLEKAYAALKAKDYDRAIAGFQEAIKIAPDRPAMRKDLAYTLLKIGETEAARDQFAEAMRLDPRDDQVALEYAFLCYETKQQAVARRIFDRYPQDGKPNRRAAPLKISTAPCAKASRAGPRRSSCRPTISARTKSSRAWPSSATNCLLAAEHYQEAWALRPDRRSLLLDLGRVCTQMSRTDEAHAALLAASRGAEPRVAEEARELLPERYPYVYEFERALALDPSNVELRRELAYLHLEMKNRAEAEKEFRAVVETFARRPVVGGAVRPACAGREAMTGRHASAQRVLSSGDEELAERVRAAMKTPQNLQKRVEQPKAASPDQARLLGEKSLEKGYLQDALKYLRIAHENDPGRFST